jgi:hypothetical protein
LPIVAVDIDGTLAEYHLRLAEFACDYHDLPVPTQPWDGLGDYEYFLGMSQAMYREAKLAYRQGGYKRTAPVMPKALDFMNWLNTQPVEIWITTTRPWSRLDSVDPDTQFWLKRHGIGFSHLLFDDHKYQKLAHIVNPDRVIAVIDDLPEMLGEAREYLPNALPFLIARPHNAWASALGEFASGTFADAYYRLSTLIGGRYDVNS